LPVETVDDFYIEKQEMMLLNFVSMLS